MSEPLAMLPSPIDGTRPESTWGESFEPDVLAAEEFTAWFRPQSPPQGERLLLLAVLEEGLTCYQRYAGVAGAEARRLFADASTWLESTDRSHLFAFESICDALTLSADDVRRRVWAWRARRLARAALRPPSESRPAPEAAPWTKAPPVAPRRRAAAPATRRPFACAGASRYAPRDGRHRRSPRRARAPRG